ncbi:beta strand repeat-containing protein [Tritonibacter mobilis]|uniref:beta strand repeat-containing protein n=1 Tax=Tritonibacter mobilis TaxID=379347 RepID=UPI003A5C529A
MDDLAGAADNDTFKGFVNQAAGATDTTLGTLDEIDGGAGTDTLEIAVSGGDLATADVPTTISNVEVITVRGTNNVVLDSSGIAGVTSLASTQSVATTLTGAATTDITVSGATGAISTEGGKNVTVTDAATNQSIEIGDTTAAEGDATVTDTKVGTGNIHVDAKGAVTIAATGSTATGNIEVGDTTEATGAISVTSTSASTPATATLHAIETNGGSTVTVAQKVDTTNASKVAAGETFTMGAVDIDGGNTTTSVTVTQDEANTAVNNQAAIAGSSQTHVVTFSALTAGQTASVNGLTFTAAKNLTAEEVAAAFANLVDEDTQTGTGPVANGTYTGASNTADFTSGAASGATVTYTEVTAGTNAAIALGGSGTNPTSVATAGTAAQAAVAGEIGVVNGAVAVDDNATKSITDITLDGYGTATLGGGAGGSLDSLSNLSLANSAAGATLTSTSKTLNLSVNDVDHTVNVGGSVETLNVTSATEASTFALTATAAKTLNVTAGANLNLNGSTYGALTTANISGAGAVNLGDASDDLTTLSAGSATGAITATVDGTKAVVTTGTGADAISIDTATITKNVNLGDGNDTLTLTQNAVATPTSSVDGGAGTNTLAINSTLADASDNTTAFGAGFTNFGVLKITDASAATLNVKNLGFASNVVLAAAHTGVLNNLASGATVELQAATNNSTLNVEDAATNASDALNLVTNVADNDLNFGTVTVADVQTISLTANDTLADDNSDGTVTTAEAPAETATVVLSAAAATTVNISGSANVVLDPTSTLTALDTLNAGSLEGVLTATINTNGVTATGGSGADKITVAANSVTVNGGAGNDTITVNDNVDQAKLSGGAGADTFVFAGAASNENNFAVIQDAASGDKIDLSALTTGNATFKSTAITLSPGATETTQALLDQAIIDLAANEVGWFTSGGNTFIVMDIAGAPDSAAEYDDGVDFAVSLTGVFDLSTASFNGTNATTLLEIA